MNKYILATILIIAIIVSCGAATTGKLKGSVRFGNASTLFLAADLMMQADIILSQDDKVITGGLTQSGGNYSIKDIPPGIYTISFKRVAFATKVYNNVKIKAGKTTRIYPVLIPDLSVTEPVGSHGFLAGIVSDTSGNKLANVNIQVIVGGKEVGKAQSQASGEYTIANLPPGACTIQVSAEGYQPQEFVNFNIDGRQTTKLDLTLVP